MFDWAWSERGREERGGRGSATDGVLSPQETLGRLILGNVFIGMGPGSRAGHPYSPCRTQATGTESKGRVDGRRMLGNERPTGQKLGRWLLCRRFVRCREGWALPALSFWLFPLSLARYLDTSCAQALWLRVSYSTGGLVSFLKPSDRRLPIGSVDCATWL